jgi:hypothetical protein
MDLNLYRYVMAEQSVFKQLLTTVVAAEADPTLKKANDGFVDAVSEHFAMLFVSGMAPLQPGGSGRSGTVVAKEAAAAAAAAEAAAAAAKVRLRATPISAPISTPISTPISPPVCRAALQPRLESRVQRVQRLQRTSRLQRTRCSVPQRGGRQLGRRSICRGQISICRGRAAAAQPRLQGL